MCCSRDANVVPAQCRFNVVQCVTDLRGKRFASYAVNNVLILTRWEFSAAAERLPESHW